MAGVLGRGQNVAKLPSPLPGFPHGTSPWLCERSALGTLGSEPPYLGREGGEEGDEGHVQTPLFLQVHLQTHPHPHILGLLEGAGSPHAILGVLGTVWTQRPVWGWGICVLGLGLHFAGGVLWGREFCLSGTSNAPHSLTSLDGYKAMGQSVYAEV